MGLTLDKHRRIDGPERDKIAAELKGRYERGAGQRGGTGPGGDEPAHDAVLGLTAVSAADLGHLLAELDEVPAEVPGGQDHRGVDQALLDVAGQRTAGHPDRLCGQRGGNKFGHLMTVTADVARFTIPASDDSPCLYDCSGSFVLLVHRVLAPWCPRCGGRCWGGGGHGTEPDPDPGPQPGRHPVSLAFDLPAPGCWSRAPRPASRPGAGFLPHHPFALEWR